MLQRLARVSYLRRRRVLVAWIVALVASVGIANAVGASFSQSLSLPGTESQRAADLLESRFPARSGDEGRIVVADSRGAETARVELEQLFEAVAEVPGV